MPDFDPLPRKGKRNLNHQNKPVNTLTDCEHDSSTAAVYAG